MQKIRAKKSIFEAILGRIWFIMSPIKYLIILTYLWINLCVNTQFSCTGNTLSEGQKWFSPISDTYLIIFREKDHFPSNFFFLFFPYIVRQDYLLRLSIEVRGRINVSKIWDLGMDIYWVWIINSDMVRLGFKWVLWVQRGGFV